MSFLFKKARGMADRLQDFRYVVAIELQSLKHLRLEAREGYPFGEAARAFPPRPSPQ